MSGVIERTSVSVTAIDDIEKALARLRGLPVTRELVKNHLWSGGWAFLKPPDAVYGVAVIGIVVLIVIALVRRKKPIPRTVWPLLAVIGAYLIAMAGHMVNGAIAAIKDPKFPTIGAEGWYLDEMRTMEACLVAVVIAAAVSERGAPRAAQILLVVLLIANFPGTAVLVLPHSPGPIAHE